MLDEDGNIHECTTCGDIEPCEQCAQPEPNCYACMGTGYIKGFGHSGERCPCINFIDPSK